MIERDLYAVEVILFHEETRKLLLMKRTRAPYTWSTVTGGIEVDEGIWQAGLREVYEETGCKLLDFYPIENVRSFYAANIDKIVHVTSFAGTIAESAPRLNEEHSDFKWVDFKDVSALVPYKNQRNAIRDAFQILCWQDPTDEAVLREAFPRAKINEYYQYLISD